MKKLYCPYCGDLLENGCECERYVAEEMAQRIEDYENDPFIQEGWRQQDIIDMYRCER